MSAGAGVGLVWAVVVSREFCTLTTPQSGVAHETLWGTGPLQRPAAGERHRTILGRNMIERPAHQSDEVTDAMQEPAAAETDGKKFDLGIIYVHGIGEQKRGEALVQIADALVRCISQLSNRTDVTIPAVELTSVRIPEASNAEACFQFAGSSAGGQRWLVRFEKVFNFWCTSIAALAGLAGSPCYVSIRRRRRVWLSCTRLALPDTSTIELDRLHGYRPGLLRRSGGRRGLPFHFISPRDPSSMSLLEGCRQTAPLIGLDWFEPTPRVRALVAEPTTTIRQFSSMRVEASPPSLPSERAREPSSFASSGLDAP
jgi:hypothetical protein